jgi:hypothetical protein
MYSRSLASGRERQAPTVGRLDSSGFCFSKQSEPGIDIKIEVHHCVVPSLPTWHSLAQRPRDSRVPADSQYLLCSQYGGPENESQG